MLAAGQPERIVSSTIEKYAADIRESGFWLEFVDAELFVRNTGGNLLLGIEQNAHSPLTLLTAADQFAHLFPEGEGPESVEIDPKNPHSWVMVSCNVNYKPDGVKNHWVPGFFRDQISADDWFDLTVVALSKCVKEYREKKSQLELLKEQTGILPQASPGSLGAQIMQTQIHDLEEEVQKYLGLVGL